MTKPHGLRQLTDAQAADLRALRESGMMLKDVAARFGIGITVASNVAGGRRAYSGKQRKAYTITNHEPVLPLECLPKLDEMIKARISISRISEIWGMSRNTIIRARDRVGVYREKL